jgi:enoyl-CoA hydratase/carnithine racemase
MELRIDEHGPHVVVVTIDNQPRRNAMPRAMMAELVTLWDQLERGPCRCIVLTGAGDRAFCAGADLSGDLSARAETARMVSDALLKYRPYSKPIVAAVNGDCAGGGLELLLATDIRAAAPHARFGLPEVRWSIYPFGGATVKLVQQIGYVHAMERLLTDPAPEVVAAAAEALAWVREDAVDVHEPAAFAVVGVDGPRPHEHGRARVAAGQHLLRPLPELRGLRVRIGIGARDGHGP